MMYIVTIIVTSLWLPLIAANDDTGDIEDAPFCEKAMELSCGLPTEHCLFWDGYACQFTNLKDLCPKWCYNLDIQGRKMFIDPLADDFTIESDKERSICFFVMPPDCFNKFPTDICLKMHSHACSIPKVGEICKKSCGKDFVYENNATDNTTRDSSIKYQKDAVDAPFCDMAISSHCGQSLPMEVCQFWDAYACEFHNLNQTCPTKCLKTESEFKMLLTSDPFKFEKHENSSEDEKVCDVLFSRDCPRTNSTKKCKDIFLHSCRIPAVVTLCPKRCANDISYKEADDPSSTPEPSTSQNSTNQLSSHPSSKSAPSARKSGNTSDIIFNEVVYPSSTPEPSPPQTSTNQLSSYPSSISAPSARLSENTSECMNLNSPCGKGNKGRCKKTCEKYEQARGKCLGDSCKCCVLRDIIFNEVDDPPSTPEPSPPQTPTNQLSSHPPSISAPSARLSGNTNDIIHFYNKEDNPSSIPGPAPPQTSTNQLSSHPPSVSAPSAILSRNTSDIIHLYDKVDDPSSIPGPAPPQTSSNQLSSHPPSVSAPSAILSRNTSDNLSDEAEVELSIPQSSPPQPSSPQPSSPQPSTPQPSTPQPSTPQPSTPQPSTPQPSTPQPSTPQTSTPQPSTPQPTTLQPSTPQPSTPQTSTPQPSTPQTSTPQSSTNQLPSHRSSIIATSEKLLRNNSDNVHKEVDAQPPPPPPPPPPPFAKLLENTGDEFILYDTLGSQTLFDPPSNNDIHHDNVGQPLQFTAIREEGCCEKVLSSACGLSEELCEIWKAYACSYRGFDKECPALCNKVVALKSNKKKIIPLVTSSEPQLLNKKKISDLLLQK